MSHRYTAAEKGKAPATYSTTEARKRICAPDLDTSALIQANQLTLIGRLTNPQEQRMSDVISSLPRKWNLEGAVSGSDLGHSCFQFRLSSERDIKSVLDNCPYHCNNWMIILQRWEPIISPSFPSQIPFWIKLEGLPLHFWHEKMIYEIGHELGHLDKYDISQTSARMRVFVDGLSPLVKDSVIDFKSGEESFITLEYEGLKNHCSLCNRLSHLSQDCPIKPQTEVSREIVTTENSRPPQEIPPSQIALAPLQTYRHRSSTPKEVSRPQEQAESPHFSQRRDRHGNPFGERISQRATWVRPLKNKITPRNTAQGSIEEVRQQRDNTQPIVTFPPTHAPTRSDRNRRDHRDRRNPYSQGNNRALMNEEAGSYNPSYARRDIVKDTTERHEGPLRDSSPYTRRRDNQRERNAEHRRSPQAPSAPPPTRKAQSSHSAASPSVNPNPRERHASTGPMEPPLMPRLPLERNLNVSDFTSPIQLRSTEEIMEELREVTYQYTNHPDPKERDARMQRVFDSESQGLMEETANRIAANETAAAMASPAQQLICFQPEPGYLQSTGQEITFSQAEEEGPSNYTRSARVTSKSNRPPKPKRNQHAPRGLLGPSLRQHNLARAQRSPSLRSQTNEGQGTTPGRIRRRSRRTLDPTEELGINANQQELQNQEDQRNHETLRGTTQPAAMEVPPTTPRVDFHHLGRDLP